MKSKKNIMILMVSMIGLTCTLICLCILFKDRIKECSLYKKFFGEEEDLDMDFFDEEFMDEEEVKEEVADKEDEEEEIHIPKARRGYIPLKFPSDQTA